MKKFIALLFTIIIVFSFTACDSEEYALSIPPREKIKYVELTKGSYTRRIETERYIDVFTGYFFDSGTEFFTTKKSKSDEPKIDKYISDAPIKIDIYTDDGTQTFYIYDKNKKRYLEQPGGGVYEITQELFSDINSFYVKLKREESKWTVEMLTEYTDILQPLDEHGVDFKTKDLTNRQLLRYGFLMFDPRNKEADDITFRRLNNDYIEKYLGFAAETAEDITCSCGRTIAEYNRENDKYVWDENFHYLQHKASSHSHIKDIYRTDNKYIVEVYKIFTDIKENASSDEYNYYVTYSDSKEQINIIETIPDPEYTEEDYLGAIGINIKLHKLTFNTDEPVHLESYDTIGYMNELTDGSKYAHGIGNPFRALAYRLAEWMFG